MTRIDELADNGADRRDYFRVEDKVYLDYEIISDEKMRVGVQELARGRSAELGISAALLRMESQLTQTLTVVEQRDKNTARALGLINNKINALVSLMPVLQDNDNNLLKKPVRRCNLSASGLAFPADEALRAGDKMMLRMVLPPAYYYIVAYAEVIRCDRTGAVKDGGSHRVAVRFTFLLDRYREMLIRHSFMKEKQALRERRLARERLDD